MTKKEVLTTLGLLLLLFSVILANGSYNYAGAATDSIYVNLLDKRGRAVWSYTENRMYRYVRVDMPLDGRGVVAVNDDPSGSFGCGLWYFDDMKDGFAGWSSLDGTPACTFIPTPDTGGNDFYSVAISGDGGYVATGPAQGSYVLSSACSVLQTFTMGTGQSYDLTFDGQFGACGNRQGEVWCFSKNSGTPLWSYSVGGIVHSVAIQSVTAPDDLIIVAGSSNGYVYAFDETGALLWSRNLGAVSGDEGGVVSVAMSNQGQFIAVGSYHNKLYLYDGAGNKLWDKPVPVSISWDGGWMGTESKSVAISADGQHIVAGGTDNLYLYNNAGTLIWSHDGEETCVAISPDGNYIAACKYFGKVHLFSRVSSRSLWTWNIGAFWVAVSNSGHVAVSATSAFQRGPRIDTLRYKVTRSPAAQLIEMTIGPPTGSDMWLGMIRPTDVEAMDDLGYSLSSRSLLHFCEFGFNMRNPPLDDVNFRHALAHLVPKEKIIGTLFKYINIPISTPTPPAQGMWYNPYTDPHPYSRAEAEDILVAGGYQKIGGVWKMPDSSDIPNLRVYIPLEIVAPTSYTIGRMFVDEAHAIGLTSLNLEPMDFSTYTSLAFDQWDFDIFWVCWSLGRFPTLLYSFFHSSNLFLGSYNCYGINYPALDAEIETFYYGLDHPAKVAAAKKCQELLMGGTTTDPLAKPAQAGREQAIPLIPVYSRNAYDVMNDNDMGTPDPEDDVGLRGAINMFGYGINNVWTYMNCYWNTPTGDRPGTTDNMVVPVHDEFPETINPTSGSTVYVWDIMDKTLEGLMATNPYTHRDEPWLAESWSYGVEAGGMYIKFDLRTTDNHGQPIKWQDGVNIAPSDVQFSWDFLADHEISRYWDDMKYYTGSDISGNEITAHMSTTSQWLIYALAGNAYLLPPPVWTPWIGEDKNDIESWDPSAEAGPAGLPTKVYGTGPFILQHSTIQVSTLGYADLEANRNGYWLETAEIQDLIAEMFHSAGDVDYIGEVNIVALQAVNLAMWTVPGDADWYANADVCGPGGTPPDSYVGIDDLGTCGKFYGEPREVPRT